MATTVFFSFHYTRDVHRVQLIKNVNALEGQPILNSQQWERVRRGGTPAIQKWIDGQMAYKRAVVVLIGKETAARPWVKYEIQKLLVDQEATGRFQDLWLVIHGHG